jgi:nitrate reductase gamma subunit
VFPTSTIKWKPKDPAMFESLFDLPLVIAGPAIIVALCLFAVVGLWLVRRRVLPRLRIHASDSDFSGAMLQSVMVFYGLAVALIAPNSRHRAHEP